MEACALRTEILGVGFDDLTIEEAADRASALLEEEGVAVSDTNIVDLQQYGWNPTEDELQWLSDCFTAMGI